MAVLCPGLRRLLTKRNGMENFSTVFPVLKHSRGVRNVLRSVVLPFDSYSYFHIT